MALRLEERAGLEDVVPGFGRLQAGRVEEVLAIHAVEAGEEVRQHLPDTVDHRDALGYRLDPAAVGLPYRFGDVADVKEILVVEVCVAATGQADDVMPRPTGDL